MMKFIFVWLLTISIVTADDSSSDPLQLPYCKDYWQEKGLLKGKAYHYDYVKDAKKGPIGNVGYQDYYKRVERDKCKKDWSILIFMAADNDLEPYAFWDMYELEAGYRGKKSTFAGSWINTDVIVELDTQRQHQLIKRYHMFQRPVYDKTDPQLGQYYDPLDNPFDLNNPINPKNPKNEGVKDPVTKYFTSPERNELEIKSPIIFTRAEVGGGRSNGPAIVDQGEKLQDFLTYSIKKYPADKYVVVIWGHGEGWGANENEKELPIRRNLSEFNRSSVGEAKRRMEEGPGGGRSGTADFGGIAVDDTEKTFIDIPSLATIFENLKKTVLDGANVNLLINDACLMQTAEVVGELRNGVDNVIGSSQVQSFLGLPYRNILKELNSGRMGRRTDKVEVLQRALEESKIKIDRALEDKDKVQAKKELALAYKNVMKKIGNYWTEDGRETIEKAYRRIVKSVNEKRFKHALGHVKAANKYLLGITRRMLNEKKERQAKKEFFLGEVDQYGPGETVGSKWKEVDEFAKMVLLEYKRSYNPTYGRQGKSDPEAHKSMTLSNVNLGNIGNMWFYQYSLAHSSRLLGKSILNYMNSTYSGRDVVSRAVQRTYSYLGSFRDFGLFGNVLWQELDVPVLFGPSDSKDSPEVKKLKMAIGSNNAVLRYMVRDRVFGESYANIMKSLQMERTSAFAGLTVFLPETQENYMKQKDMYEKSWLYSVKWDNDEGKAPWASWMFEMFQSPPDDLQEESPFGGGGLGGGF